MAKPAEQPAKQRRATQKFPKMTLMDALCVAQAIQDNNAGRPYERLDLARALKTTPRSSKYAVLLVASGQYGLTEGGYHADKIKLTGLGRSIVAPKSEEERKAGLKTALFSIPFFKDFYTKYDNNRLPAAEFIKNTLSRDYEIPAEDTEACYQMIVANARQLGIIYTDLKGTEYIRLSRLGAEVGVEKPQPPPAEEGFEELAPEKTKYVAPPVTEMLPEKEAPRVFISHGKNKKVVEQVKEVVAYVKLEPVIAEEEETTAVPVSDKVLESMRRCQFGIMNISFDDQEKREDGSYGVNQNVLIEIGAAFVLYNKKIILLRDERVTIPSNLEGLYRCEYKGDELDGKTIMKLLKALAEFQEEQ